MTKKEFNVKVGAYLREFRTTNGFSQTDMARFLGLKSRNTIMKYESGAMGMPFYYIVKLVRQSDLRLMDLFKHIVNKNDQ